MLCKLLRAATFAGLLRRVYYSYVHESVLSRRTSPVSPGKMGTICRGVVPSNTKKATSWAVCVFEEWRRERNATATGEQWSLGMCSTKYSRPYILFLFRAAATPHGTERVAETRRSRAHKQTA